MGMNEEESVRLAGVVGSVSLDGSDKSRKKNYNRVIRVVPVSAARTWLGVSLRV
jgi:hypothetical protein